MKIPKSLQNTFAELVARDRSLNVIDPFKEIDITNSVLISRVSLDHVIERRGVTAKQIVFSLALVLNDPSKISDNSRKRPNSLIYCRKVGRTFIRVIVEKTKTPGKSRVVSAFPISRNAYEKLIDISGRAHTPPFELPPKR